MLFTESKAVKQASERQSERLRGILATALAEPDAGKRKELQDALVEASYQQNNVLNARYRNIALGLSVLGIAAIIAAGVVAGHLGVAAAALAGSAPAASLATGISMVTTLAGAAAAYFGVEKIIRRSTKDYIASHSDLLDTLDEIRAAFTRPREEILPSPSRVTAIRTASSLQEKFPAQSGRIPSPVATATHAGFDNSAPRR